MLTRLAIVTAAVTALLGCAASTSQQRLNLSAPGQSSTTQPTDAGVMGVQQLSGQIVAGVQAELSNQVDTQLSARATGVAGDLIGYRSEFGVGATVIVALTLLLALILSHRREMLRIKRNGKHVSQ